MRERTAYYDTDYLSGDPAFTHAHVTALGPFLDELDPDAEAVVAGIARRTEPFDFVLADLDTFPDGIVHLVPEPAGPFSALTRRLVEAFPQCPPYGGRVPDPQPHLTLDARSATVTEESTRQSLGGLLPARCRADRLDLAWYEAGACRVLRSWALGSPDAD